MVIYVRQLKSYCFMVNVKVIDDNKTIHIMQDARYRLNCRGEMDALASILQLRVRAKVGPSV